MFEQQPELLRQKVQQLANQYQEQGDPTSWFDVLYTQAQGDPSQIPWAKMTPNPILQDWLNLSKHNGEGKTALVIGCGLGDDAEALSQLGFNVTAFDIAKTAIAWCRQRFPNSKVNYLVADLLNLDPAWKFDLVIESRTIQSLPLELRDQVIAALGKLVKVEGTLLIITRFRETEDPPAGPPWPISESELSQFNKWGLTEANRTLFIEAENDSVKQFRIEFRN